VRKNPTTKLVLFLEHASRIFIVVGFYSFYLFVYFLPNDLMNNNCVPTKDLKLLDVYNILDRRIILLILYLYVIILLYCLFNCIVLSRDFWFN